MSERSILKKISQVFEWKEYVEEHHPIKYASNGELRICCPACGEQDFKCYVNTKHGVFNCFKCDFKTGRKFNLADFVAVTEGIPRGTALIRLIQEYKPMTPVELDLVFEEKRIETPPESFLDEIKIIPGFPEGVKLLTEDVGPEYWKYLYERGFTKEEILAYRTHYVPYEKLLLTVDGKIKGDLGRRVVWPVYGGHQDLISWIARTIVPGYSGGDKYLNCPGSDIAKTFWPYVPPYGKEAVLVEGLADCAAVRRVPGISAYATFGKHLSVSQVKILKMWGVTDVTLFYDKDVKVHELDKIVDDLKCSFKNVYVLWQDELAKDVDAGDLLKSVNGTAIIDKVLKNKVHHDSLDYVTWKIKY